jgi:anoctamin-10
MKGWFVPVDLIRDYYGDETAIYFEWMNFFLRWISVPGLMGLVIKILNYMLYEDVSKSPLNAFFSIVMAIWAALFSVNWLRHQRSLRILWDNLYNSEHHI